jgi:hypothetical protein
MPAFLCLSFLLIVGIHCSTALSITGFTIIMDQRLTLAHLWRLMNCGECGLHCSWYDRHIDIIQTCVGFCPSQDSGGIVEPGCSCVAALCCACMSPCFDGVFFTWSSDPLKP